MTDLTTNPSPQKPYGRTVLYWIMGFFAVFIIVDAIFVYIAVTTHTGVIAEHSYEKGLAYDENLAEAKRQEALGLQVETSFKNDTLLLSLKDKEGQAIENATVTAHLIRPVQAGYDFETPLQHVGDGLYEAKPQLPLKGLWEADLDIEWQDNTNTQQTYQTAMSFNSR